MGLALLQRRQLFADLPELVQIPLDAFLAVRLIHELIEALGEVHDGPFDIPQAQDLAGNRGQLLEHLRGDVV